MNQDDFEKKMEGLQSPDTDVVRPPGEVKLAILSARRSAAMGIWFVVTPCYFLFCVIMKYYFHVNLGLFDAMIEIIAELDKSPASWFLGPVMIVGLPLAGIVLNALAIIHVSYQPAVRSIQITIKLRWVNLLIILVSAILLTVFLAYVIVENVHHANPSP